MPSWVFQCLKVQKLRYGLHMPFERVFNEIAVRAEPFALCELQGQCSLGLDSQSGTTLHYILAGRGELVFKGRTPVPIEPGTLVLVPTLRSHTLRSFGHPGTPVPDCHPAELDLASHLRSDGNGATEGKLLAICSHVNIGLRGTSDLINLIREPVIEKVTAQSPMLAPIEQMLVELSSPSLGSRALIRAILTQCMIHLLRNRLVAGDVGLNWMAALVDERLWTALRTMLEKPGHPHSLDSLAATAGMSRSSFADKFSRACGHGPMEMLRGLRMHTAAALLAHSDLPVKRISEQVGFLSRSAFSRAFSSTCGTSPDTYRKNHRNNRD